MERFFINTIGTTFVALNNKRLSARDLLELLKTKAPTKTITAIHQCLKYMHHQGYIYFENTFPKKAFLSDKGIQRFDPLQNILHESEIEKVNRIMLKTDPINTESSIDTLDKILGKQTSIPKNRIHSAADMIKNISLKQPNFESTIIMFKEKNIITTVVTTKIDIKNISAIDLYRNLHNINIMVGHTFLKPKTNVTETTDETSWDKIE
jgi:hypothetical protein